MMVFRSALSSVFQHKMRAFLTMLGIIIGISSVILISALGSGVKNQVLEEMSSYNMSVIEVQAMNISSMEHFMRLSDIEALYNIENVQYVSAENSFWGMDLHLLNGETEEGYIGGIDANYRYIEEMDVKYGRLIADADVVNRLNVCVIQETRAMDVFGRSDVVGEKVVVDTWMGEREFTVIGVLQRAPGMGVMGTTAVSALFMVPITALNDIYGQEDIVNLLSVVTSDGSNDTAALITRMLSVRHDNPDGYYAQSLTDMAEGVESMVTLVSAFVTFVAAISLFVGGVGVMNIMLVSVKERTREIGIRKSLGATNANIRRQFLIEAVILTGIGGVIGILLGLTLAALTGFAIVSLSNIPIQPNASSATILGAFGVSAVVGLFFGVYPAGKAAKLNPIEALRYE